MDVDLDSYIKDKGIRYPGRGRGGGGGPNRRGGNRGNAGRGGQGGGNRSFGGNFSNAMVSRRQPVAAFTSRPSLDISGGSTLHISNLDFGVNNQDIGELFGEFGAIRRFAVHFDEMGRSLGSAEVHYLDPRDALRALTKYNGVPLDGRAMRIELSGNLARGSLAAATMRSGASFGPSSNTPRRSFGGMNRRGRGTGGGGGGKGGNRKSEPPSKEDLDAELDSFKEKAS